MRCGEIYESRKYLVCSSFCRTFVSATVTDCQDRATDKPALCLSSGAKETGTPPHRNRSPKPPIVFMMEAVLSHSGSIWMGRRRVEKKQHDIGSFKFWKGSPATQSQTKIMGMNSGTTCTPVLLPIRAYAHPPSAYCVCM